MYCLGKIKPRKILIAAALALMTLPATAHHGRSIYDTQNMVSIEGVVTRFQWANPHVYMYVEVPNDAGESVVWAIEHGSATAMRRRGWSRDSFVPGDSVVVQAHPARDPERAMALVYSVEKAGITRLGRGEAQEIEAASQPAEGLTGTWVVQSNPFPEYFAEPFDWPMSGPGREALASYDDLSMNPQVQCTSRTAPWTLVSGTQRIEVGATTVRIHSEYDSIERIVHLGPDSHDGAEVSRQGHSIGRWEGDTLVVDTSLFADHRTGNARGIPSGSRKHLVERFELNAQRTGLTYSFELRDPAYLAAPVRGEVLWSYRPDLEFIPVPCDPESAGRFVEQD